MFRQVLAYFLLLFFSINLYADRPISISLSTQTLRPIDFALGGSVISPQGGIQGGGLTPGGPVFREIPKRR